MATTSFSADYSSTPTSLKVWFDAVIWDNTYYYYYTIYLYDSEGRLVHSGWQRDKYGGQYPYYLDQVTGFSTADLGMTLPSNTGYVCKYQVRRSISRDEAETGQIVFSQTIDVWTKLPYFDWDTKKKQGQPIVIYANEWNRLAQLVSDEVTYVGNGPQYIPTVVPNDPITAYLYNYFVDVFALQLGYNTTIRKVTAFETKISEYNIDLLKTTINNIINRYNKNSRPEPKDPK